MSRLSRRGLLAGALAVGAVPARAAVRPERHAFELTAQSVFLEGLSEEHHGVKIAQLSDLHVGKSTPDARLRAAVRAVNDAKPDLVVLTGDFVTVSTDPFERIPEVLGGLQAPTFAIYGNHDHRSGKEEVARQIHAMGYALLQNQHTVLDVRGKPLALIGVDDGVTRHDDVAASFKGVSDSMTRFVLAHAPTTIERLPRDAGLFCVSGHTHGGQLYFRGFTDEIFRRVRQPYVRGLYGVNGNTLYVNRGLGFGSGSVLPRVHSEPEVSIFTLKRATLGLRSAPPAHQAENRQEQVDEVEVEGEGA